MKNNYFFNSIILLPILFLLINCGGGGSGGSTTKYNYSETASDHKTTEYNNQYGLGSIKAAEGYAALGGYTEGGPIKVAVLDTGIDSNHSQLENQITSGGYDFVNDDSDPEDNQVGGIGHGTHVSGIIAAEKTGTGMHGVCPNCDIIPIKVLNDSNPASGTWGDLASAIDRARSNGAKVINMSLGGGSPNNSTLETAIKAATDAGIILVSAAGNTNNSTTASYPAAYADDSDVCADALCISVGNVNSSNALNSTSNIAGAALKNYHVVAPGTDIYSTTNDGSYAEASGTSMAAPHVSGALALLFEEFPNLTAAQIKDLLYNNTTDLGDSGIDNSFGRGLINLYASINASSSSQSIPLTENLNGNSSSIENTMASLSNAFSTDLKNNNLLADSIIIDGYNRAYRNNLTAGISINKSNLPSISFSNFDQEKKIETVQNKISNFQSTTAIQYTSNDKFNDSLLDYNDINLLNTELNYTLNDNSKINIIYNKSANARLGFDQIDTFTNNLTLDSSETLSNPYLNYIKQPTNYSFEKHLDISEKLNTHIIDSSLDESYGLISEYTNTSLKNKFISFSVGYLNEDNSILGSSFSGAFGNLDNSETFFTDSSLAYKMNTNNEILLKIAYANSQTNFEDLGLINEFSNIESSYYSLGYGKKSLLLNNDKSTFSLTRPLKVDNGNIDMAVPKYATSDNRIIRENSNIDLTPDNNQLNLEFNYNINKDNNIFNIGLLSIINNNHSNQSSIENLFKLSYNYSL